MDGKLSDHLQGCPGIGCSHIRNDLDMLARAQRQDMPHSIKQQLVISLIRIPGSTQLGQRDSAFRQALKDHVVNVPPFHNCQCRFDAVATIACPGPDAYRSHVLPSFCALARRGARSVFSCACASSRVYGKKKWLSNIYFCPN